MKARELRIGNYIGIIHAGIETKVIAEHIKFIAEGDTSYKPIPLTEEWILKFGFKYTKAKGAGGQDQWSGLGFISNGKINFRGHPASLMLEGYFNTNIEFVHQLQNLYFALTGEELTITN